MELVFDRLTKEYGAKIAVDRVCATLGPGVHGLLGTSIEGENLKMSSDPSLVRFLLPTY